jgi:NADH:ubiquinone oxidoreductase subunit F (NADH-binding)
VLDGAEAAAAAVGARRIVIAVGRGDARASAAVAGAIAERHAAGGRARFELAAVPDRFVAGEETALVQWLDGGPAKPSFVPPRPYERGVGGRPTLVQNVETLAGIALVARHGSDAYRARGTPAEPGSRLVTLVGDVARPGVAEVDAGTPMAAVLDGWDGPAARPRALLLGGYFGSWVPAGAAHAASLCEADLRPLGASLGAGTIGVLSPHRCGLVETARIVGYLSRESAGQCGPCVFGLQAMAGALHSLAVGDRDAAGAVKRLRRLAPQVAGRGACAHPTGATRLTESALEVFAEEIAHHLAGRCSARRGSGPVLPIPAESAEWR